MENLSWQRLRAALLDSMSKCRENGAFLRNSQELLKTLRRHSLTQVLWKVREEVRRAIAPAAEGRRGTVSLHRPYLFVMRVDLIALLPFLFLLKTKSNGNLPQITC